MDYLLVSQRTLIWELAAFFLCGGISCLCGGISHFIPILQAKPPYGEAGDDTWRFVALGLCIMFLAVKLRIVFALRDREIERIKELPPGRRYVFQCYKVSRVILLAILITTAKVTESYTEESYASRLIFTASASAVGVLLTAASFSTVLRLLRDKSLGLGEEDGDDLINNTLERPLTETV